MILYIGIICLSLFLFLIDFKSRYSFLALLCLFVCFGYTTGSDWVAYEMFYTSLYETKQFHLTFFKEPGFVLYNFLFVKLGFDFWHFFIFTKISLFIIIFSCFQKYSPQHTFYLSLTFFIAWYTYFMFIDNPMRNVIAVAIFLLSLESLKKGHLIHYSGWTALATLFHYSALIMVLFYFLRNKTYKTKTIIIVYLIANILFLSPEFLYGMLKTLFFFSPNIIEKLDIYSQGLSYGSGKIVSLGMIIHNIFFVIIILARKHIEEIPNGKMIFLFSIIFLIFYRIGLTATVLGRLQLYLAIFYTIAIGVSINKFTKKSSLIYVFYVLLVSVIPCIHYLKKDNRYIPYTNYIFIDKNMSFEERINYNNQQTKN